MIDTFSGEYKFLSNFYRTPIHMDGLTYLSVEHAYQAAKTLNIHERFLINAIDCPASAKQAGRYVTMRDDWRKVKLNTMRCLLKQKFEKEELYCMLVKTRPHELVEGNWWGDTYWGICRGEGENHLGKLLMEIRDNPFSDFL